ncbi:PREDICTED: lactosylceramide 4-alpha-galactosyltransferase [Erythranthe guttata]|nr:PREDICTED: lactosylceramide 4-alpha-galactosyltransferase [Erythranthe guttata]|eukprot:XP_012850418.1 PREDICTED: lactosylceramide 4-alpha-galactosyltransferase [Erythranthe guttata]
MFDCLKSNNILTSSSLSFTLIIFVIILTDSIFSNVSLHSSVFQQHQTNNTNHDQVYCSTRFHSRVEQFSRTNQCKVNFFMTWISPANSFGQREFFALESLFQTNPESCLIIISTTMDSEEGFKILEPLISLGFRVQSISPDLSDLLKNTPAETWLVEIKNGIKNPGEIPLAQNLSNLIRLAVLYKYGGVYLDMDFVVLKDFSGLRNSIGAQSIDANGKWSRLNNAVLVFDKKHPLIYKFMEEFALTFDGNIWGHNGPYLVSRVVDRVAKTKDFNFTVLPPMAFYPIDWTRISRFFARPNDPATAKWVEAKIRHLNRSTYGVHLWNRKSSKFKIEEGSIIWRLVYDHCLICHFNFSTS